MRRHRIPLFHIFLVALTSAGWTSSGLAAAPARADAVETGSSAVAAAIREEAGGGLKRFYAGRGFRLLWATGDKLGARAGALISYLKTADRDGLNPSSYDVDDLREMVREARGGDPEAVARAELELSATFVRYVRDQRRVRGVKMRYADPGLKPKKPSAEGILRAAAFPASFDDYVNHMDWMSPHYVRVRQLLGKAEKQGMAAADIARLHRNLDRARLLPGPWTSHIVVDASSAQLWYYQAGEQVGTMRVVVGAAETQTPMLAGMLQWAILNPYWNVPDYLVRKRIAPKVLGGRTLAMMNIEALSDWSTSPHRLDPATIDWAAVAAGTREVRLRELPGADNSMGRVKFVFPNEEGIYLHDTPERALLEKNDRHFSNGCIRLENAPALGRWLLQRPVRTSARQPEQAVPLPVPVPVYLTYITAVATGNGPAFRPDVYGRDK